MEQIKTSLTLEEAAQANADGWLIPTVGALKGSFKKGAEWQKEQDKYISVSDQLPEIGEFILIANTEGAVLVGRLMKNGWFAYFADGEKDMGELTATHWRKLPIPPNQ
jgi:hypothetical protein